jgi:hypothetical protein
MRLIRLDPSPTPDEHPDNHIQEAYYAEPVEDALGAEYSTLKARFPRFGRGTQRRSDFEVEITWLDVQQFVRTFMEMEHPQALQIRRMLKVVDAIENAGWHPTEGYEKEFWDILPESDRPF